MLTTDNKGEDKNKNLSWRGRIGFKEFSLHVADPGSVPGTAYGLLRRARSVPEHQWM